MLPATRHPGRFCWPLRWPDLPPARSLSARYPRAAGAALYTQNGFASVRVGQVVGLLVAVAGIVSSAALMNGFVGYLHEFIAVKPGILIAICVALLTGVAAWGVTQSVIIAGLISVLEVGGLLWLVLLGADQVQLDAIVWPSVAQTNLAFGALKSLRS